MIKLEVMFERRLFGTIEGSFSVFSARPIGEGRKLVSVDSRYNTFTISGDYFIEDNEMGRRFTVTVVEDEKAQYANSYKLIRLHYDLPTTPEAQWAHLDSMLTPLQAMEFANKFSRDTLILDIIINDVKAVTDVKYFGEDRAEALRDRVLEDQGKAILFNRFGSIDGVGPSVIKAIYNWMPSVTDAIDKIEQNPFVLMKLPKIGFGIADKFREALKMPLDSEQRCLYGLEHFLMESFQNSGDTYASLDGALQFSSKKLSVTPMTMTKHMKNLIASEELQKLYKLKVFGKFISTLVLYEAERIIYNKINYLKTDRMNILKPELWDKYKKEVLEETEANLTEEQESFLDTINTERISLLIGPGGAGKSWVTNLAVKILEKAGISFGLFAPTARAAHVMTDYIGFPAQTIHRGLMKYHATQEVTNYQVLFVDEASMIDSELMEIVLSTMPTHGRIIVIGDDFQLPSVGPGNILYNLINDLNIPMIKLTKIFRQGEGSHILKVATDIRENSFSLPEDESILEYNDITFINETDAGQINNTSLNIYKKSIKKVKDPKSIMFLSSVNKGLNGRKHLNKEIQEIVNPGERPAMIFGKNLEDENAKTYFKEGDYIAIKKNDYSREDEYGDTQTVINGDLGDIVAATDGALYLSINDLRFKFTKDEVVDYIEHAWAITIHKSQGGQAKEVIIVVPENSGMFMSANMLYTAITRATTKCTIVGDFKSLNRASKKFVNFHRKTMLGLKSQINKHQAQK